MGRKVLIDEQYLYDIADAIRNMKGTHDKITTDSMAREIEQAEIVWDPQEKWQRPLDWPDYSAIDISNFEGMYFTYDTSQVDNYNEWVGIYCACPGGYKVEQGQIVNGVFQVERTVNKATGSTFEEWLPYTVTGYVVYRVTPATAGNQILSIGLRDMTTALRTDGRVSRTYLFQPIKERYGRLPYLQSFSNWGNYFVESDTILDLTQLTTLYSAWNTCSHIENIDITGFDSEVTSCNSTFNACRRLRFLNCTDKFVTSNCTTMQNMFNECYCLPFVDCAGWDTQNVTRMDYLFANCHNLHKADVSNWNVEKVTALPNLFTNCNKLKEIDLSNWIVNKPTNWQNMFYGCAKIRELDLSGFDSSNVTSMYGMFAGCNNLQYVDVSHFDTYNVTTMYQMFYNCRSLKNVDVSNFYTYKVTTFQSMFDSMYNLNDIDLSNIDFSSATNIRSLMYAVSWRKKQITFPRPNLMPNSDTMQLGSANASTGTWRTAGSNTMTRSRVLIEDDVYGFQNSGTQTANDGSAYGIDNFPTEPNTDYVISMDARIVDGTEGYAGFQIYRSTAIDGSHIRFEKNFYITPLSTSWKRCWFHFKTDNNATRNIYIGIRTGETSVTTQMCRVKIEKGTTPTAYHDFSGAITDATYSFGNLQSVEELDVSMFNLNSVANPEQTFRYNYSMQKCILPDTLHNMGAYFFGDCRNLATVVMPSTTLVSLKNVNAFSGANRDKVIYVPDNLVASYPTATNWKSITHVTFAPLSTYSG